MFLDNRAEKLSILEESLRQIPKKSYSRYTGPYIHTNDAGMEMVLEQIKGLRIYSDKLKLGLTIGTGAILSVLPDLDVKAVMVVDKNPYITEWIQYAASQLFIAQGLDDYETRVYSFSNPLAEELGGEYQVTRLRPSGSERRSLGEFHMFSSEERFALCQQALKDKKLMTVNMSLCNRLQIEKLREAIENAGGEIVYINLTNIWHWEGSILKTYLEQLPFHPEAIIQFSTGSVRYDETDLWSCWCRGLEAYYVSAANDLFE